MLAQRMPKSEKHAHSRVIRVHLGDMQHAPTADRLAKLMEYLSEQLEDENRDAK